MRTPRAPTRLFSSIVRIAPTIASTTTRLFLLRSRSSGSTIASTNGSRLSRSDTLIPSRTAASALMTALRGSVNCSATAFRSSGAQSLCTNAPRVPVFSGRAAVSASAASRFRAATRCSQSVSSDPSVFSASSMAPSASSILSRSPCCSLERARTVPFFLFDPLLWLLSAQGLSAGVFSRESPVSQKKEITHKHRQKEMLWVHRIVQFKVMRFGREKERACDVFSAPRSSVW